MFSICCKLETNEEDKQAERIIDEHKKKFNRIKTCLILGTSDCGKSTIIKQMKIMNMNGFTENEKKNAVGIIYGNILESLVLILAEMEKRKLSFQKIENEENAKLINSSFSRTLVVPTLSKAVIAGIRSLISDSAVSSLANNATGFFLPSSTMYFFTEFERIAKTDWVPTDDDMLRYRAPSTGVHEVDFPLAQKNITIRMVDVGGQKTERRKWIHFFDQVSTIIFCAAISDYDLYTAEDEKLNRMEDSLNVFGGVVNCAWFNNASFVLFLNKKDIFFEKITKVSLALYFPEYEGSSNPEQAVNFILNMYKRKNKSKAKIYPQ